MHVVVDHAALVRGHTVDGELCEIPGVGPVPVATARHLLGDAVVKLMVRRGVDIVHVTHLGRTVTAHQRTALERRDPVCVVPGCGQRHGLEIDHVTGWVITKTTKLDDLARLCRFHHHLKTHEGFVLRGPPGRWSWHPPGQLDDEPPGDHGVEGWGDAPANAETFRQPLLV